jgi:hypothetical protein
MAMNRLITLPIAMLLILSFVGVAMGTSGFTHVLGPSGDTGPYINGTAEPGWNVATWDLSQVTLLIGVVIGLGLLVAFLGLTVFGTKVLSDTGQVLLFKTLGYFGLYLALSGGSAWAFNSIGTWGSIAYIMLTAMFSLGFIMDIRLGSA